MDSQTLFNIVLGVASGLGGFMLKLVFGMIEKLENKIAEMPHMYVQKEDYQNDIYEIKSKLDRIWDKLDSKVDK